MPKLAKDDRRIFTEDTDFGELAYAEGQRNCGAIVFRFPATVRGPMAAAALDATARLGDKLQGKFTVYNPAESEPAEASGNFWFIFRAIEKGFLNEPSHQAAGAH